MRQLITKPFPYFVGIYSLEELVTRDSRVCVINILGSESRKVTPVSHEYSGGNVVAGVQYGRQGVLETNIGNIPVFRSVRDVMDAGIRFDVGVIYLPPTAVSQAVWELVRYNKNLKRIVIVTEKVPTRDSRNIRYICQDAGVDVVGCNCLGVANAWDEVRIGGALGGDNPKEALRKGSIAIHSNSGNFTTTIAEYLSIGGFGISSVVSSGKDVYIHFALPEFLYAAQNDPRTKAVALYVEPGGYYERQALDWIQKRKFGFNKPIVVCVTGRWKTDLSRSCGHAGAMAGSGDDAAAKEQWFDNYFGIGVYHPENPMVSKKGVRIANIQHFPEAMKAVFAKIDEKPDFEGSGDLSLKLWISDNLIKLPDELDLNVRQAPSPYDQQIDEISKQIGANFLRQNMRNKSGASKMDPVTQVSELHGKSVLELATTSVEENLYFAIAEVAPSRADLRIFNILLNVFLKTTEKEMAVVDLAKENGATPNAYLGAFVNTIGNMPLLKKVQQYSRWIIDLIRRYDIFQPIKEYPKALEEEVSRHLNSSDGESSLLAEVLMKEVLKAKNTRPPLMVAHLILKMAEEKSLSVSDEEAFLLATLSIYIFWNPMLANRISRATAEEAVHYIYVVAKMVAASVIDRKHNSLWQKFASNGYSHLTASFTQNIFRILFNRAPQGTELIEIQYLLGLTITNGPGTISAKGAKESVSARNHIATAFTGFLCNTGLAHGGNGFEAIAFLMDNFRETALDDPGNKDSKIDLQGLATQTAKIYAKYKTEKKEIGELNYKRIPCVNHPVFKGNAVNVDPREDFIRKEFEQNNITNIFLDFYHYLVKELFNEGVTQNVFCVNVDAVLAVIALKLLWKDLQSKRYTTAQVQDLVFILFILGRSIGVAAEIADHRVRGQDMDCRTPQKEITFVP